MQPKMLLISALHLISLLVQAQTKRQDSGCIIYTLARDTTWVAYYYLTGDDFTTTFVERDNLNSVKLKGLVVTKLKGRFFPNGELQYMEGYKYKPAFGQDSVLLQTFRLYQNGDSTYVRENKGDIINEGRYAGRTMVGFYPYIYMPVILANYVPANVGDSIVGNQFGDTSAKFVVKRISERIIKSCLKEIIIAKIESLIKKS